MALPGVSAAFDLGLGDMLNQQRDDMTEEERKKRKLGASDTQSGLFDFGRTGVASIDLALPGAGMGAAGGRR